METRYRRPDDDLIEAVVRDALCSRGIHRNTWEFIESGSSSVVVLAADTAVRVARDAKTGAELCRAQALVDRLPELPFGVPRSVGEPVSRGQIVAVPTRRLDGEPHPHGSGEADTLRGLLDVIHSLDPAPLREWLAPARSFSGGVAWHEVMIEQVLPRLPAHVRGEALRRISALAALRPPVLTVNHGDLAGSNILWRRGRVTGVLDWDLAAEDDPAEDVASLAGWHGWDLVSDLADPDTVARAAVFRASFPLQVIAFALVHERSDDEVERGVHRAVRAMEISTQT
nr:phosphotransferase [Microbacterium protaetiae]